MAKDPFTFGELNYGTLNNLGETEARNSGSRRRGTSKTFLNAALQQAYSKDSLRGTTFFYGIVVSARQTTAPAYAKKDTLLKDVASIDANAGDNWFVYKVYIPEIECRPYPKSLSDPVIYTYPDVYPGKAVDKEQISVGAVVKIEYANTNTLKDPMIIGVEGDIFFKFEGMDTAKLAKLWKTQPPSLLVGLTENGDRLRTKLDELGVQHSGARMTEAGDLDATFVDNLVALFDGPMGTLLASYVFSIGTGVSFFHQNHPTSQHNKGNALDITLRSGLGGPKIKEYKNVLLLDDDDSTSGPWSWEDQKIKSNPKLYDGHEGSTAQMLVDSISITQVRDIFASATGVNALDEYNNPSKHATDPHFHISGRPRK